MTRVPVGCHHHWSASRLYQEQRAVTRSGDASDQERQSVALGMKAHIGVSMPRVAWTHSLLVTAANEHDLNQLGNLLHGEEQFVSGDAGYQGAPQMQELAEVDVDWLIAERPGKVRTLNKAPTQEQNSHQISNT